jgi:hypothetical protein
MSDASAKARANKRKGAAFEIDLETFFRGKFLNTTRLVRRGKDDEGDLLIRVHDLAVIVEAKNEKSISLGTYMQEATSEALRWEAKHIHEPMPADLVIGVAAVKRRMSSTSKSYVVMEAEDFAELLLHLQKR